jgi:hypothetical protein
MTLAGCVIAATRCVSAIARKRTHVPPASTPITSPVDRARVLNMADADEHYRRRRRPARAS